MTTATHLALHDDITGVQLPNQGYHCAYTKKISDYSFCQFFLLLFT